MSDSQFNPQKSPSHPAAEQQAPNGALNETAAANGDLNPAEATAVDAVRFWLRLVRLH